MKKFIALIVFVLLSVWSFRSFSIFVMPPMEPVSKGATFILWKNQQLGFLSSPDSVCEQLTLNDNQACRAAIMAMVYAEKDKKVVFELPYIQILHWFA